MSTTSRGPGHQELQLENYVNQLLSHLRQGDDKDVTAFETNIRTLEATASATKVLVLLALVENAVRRAEAAEERVSASEAKIPSLSQSFERTPSTELQEAYTARASAEAKAWELALAWVLAAIVGTIAAAIAAHIVVGDTAIDARTVEIVSAAALPAFVVGIGIHLIRLTVQQFRAHRHLQVLNKRKADALATFHRIVGSSSNPEVKAAIARSLAQFVFNPGSTGLLEGSGDQITVVDHLATAMAKR